MAMATPEGPVGPPLSAFTIRRLAEDLTDLLQDYVAYDKPDTPERDTDEWWLYCQDKMRLTHSLYGLAESIPTIAGITSPGGNAPLYAGYFIHSLE